MKKHTNRHYIFNIASSILAILFVLILLINNTSALAMNTDYVNNIRAWDDVDTYINIDEDEICGNLKYIFNDNENCMYFYFNYMGDMAKDTELDTIYFGIRIKNSANQYEIKINCDGISDDTTAIADKKVNVKSKFCENNIKRGTGKIFIAMELMDKTDKSLYNLIDCFFCTSKGYNVNIITDYEFDLTPPITTKKATTAKATTQRSTKEKTEKTNTTKKSDTKTTSKEKTTKITTTKFSPNSKKYFTQTSAKTTKAATKAKSTTKYTYITENAELTEENEKQTQATEEITQNTSEQFTEIIKDNVNIKMSKTSKLVAVFALLSLLSGITFILIAIIKSKSDKTNSQEIEQDEAEIKNNK